MTESVIPPEIRARNIRLGLLLLAFALAIAGVSIWMLASTRYNPFVEDPQYIIKPRPEGQ